MEPAELIDATSVEFLDRHGWTIVKKRDLMQLQAQSASIGYIHPGIMSPPECWPDDTEINESIDEAESLNEALFDIADKYGLNVTNNSPRWQNGYFMRDVVDFIEDVRKAVEKHGL